MALVPTLHHDLSSQALKASEPAATTNPFTASNQTGFRGSAEENTRDPIHDHLQGASTVVEPEPEPAQQVFERAPLPESSRYRQLAVTTLVVPANLVQMIVNFAGVAGGRKFSESMHVRPTYATWMAASYGLIQGTFVLMSGRLGDVYGHCKMLLGGGVWLALCTFVSAFCHNNFFAFVTMRALARVGGAVAMIAITNPPGHIRNLSLGVFAVSAPLGGYFSALFLGAFLENTHWRWFFIFVASLGAVTFIPLWLLSRDEVTSSQNEKIDWIGAALGTSPLILFNFVWNQAPSVGWSTPYEIALLITSIIFSTLFVIWEHKTSQPMMPPEILKLLPLPSSSSSFSSNTWPSAQSSGSRYSGYKTSGTGRPSSLPLAGPRLSYAAQGQPVSPVFPSVVLFSFCPDLVYTVGQIIASKTVRRHQQGVAGSIIGTLNLYGNSLGLGFASTIEVQIAQSSGNAITGYRAALLFGVAISAVALILDVVFVRHVKDEREGWEEGDEDVVAIELDQAATTGAQVSRLESGQAVVQRVD